MLDTHMHRLCSDIVNSSNDIAPATDISKVPIVCARGRHGPSGWWRSMVSISSLCRDCESQKEATPKSMARRE